MDKVKEESLQAAKEAVDLPEGEGRDEEGWDDGEDDEPVMERTMDTTDSVEISVLLSNKDMFRYLLRHNYTRPSGVIGVALGLLAVVLILRYHQGWPAETLMTFVLIAMWAPVMQPIQLRSKAKRQIKMQKMFAEPFRYYFLEEGFVICQNEQFLEVKWVDVRKAVRTKNAVYLYMSSVRAFILPKRQCGDKWDELNRLVAGNVRR